MVAKGAAEDEGENCWMKNMLARTKEFMKNSGGPYIIFGILTTIVALAVYYLCTATTLDPSNPIQLQIANVISWVAGVTFAYITNRKWVFKSRNKKYVNEIIRFFGARLVTLFLDMAIMFIGVNIIHFDDRLVKIFSQCSVIVANYVLSRLFVFTTLDSNDSKEVVNDEATE